MVADILPTGYHGAVSAGVGPGTIVYVAGAGPVFQLARVWRNAEGSALHAHEFTMLGLAEMVIRLTGSKSQIVHKPLPHDDPRQRKPDISKAKKILKWEPKVKLADGLKDTIAYFRTKV